MTINYRIPVAYWIEFHHIVCPICGKTRTTKEKVFDREKPLSSDDRHFYHESYCGCQDRSVSYKK